MFGLNAFLQPLRVTKFTLRGNKIDPLLSPLKGDDRKSSFKEDLEGPTSQIINLSINQSKLN
jgi:hypothetical protein